MVNTQNLKDEFNKRFQERLQKDLKAKMNVRRSKVGSVEEFIDENGVRKAIVPLYDAEGNATGYNVDDELITSVMRKMYEEKNATIKKYYDDHFIFALISTFWEEGVMQMKNVSDLKEWLFIMVHIDRNSNGLVKYKGKPMKTKDYAELREINKGTATEIINRLCDKEDKNKKPENKKGLLYKDGQKIYVNPRYAVMGSVGKENHFIKLFKENIKQKIYEATQKNSSEFGLFLKLLPFVNWYDCSICRYPDQVDPVTMEVMCAKEIAEAVGHEEKKVLGWLKKLEEHGIILSIGSGRYKFFVVHPDFAMRQHAKYKEDLLRQFKKHEAVKMRNEKQKDEKRIEREEKQKELGELLILQDVVEDMLEDEEWNEYMKNYNPNDEYAF